MELTTIYAIGDRVRYRGQWWEVRGVHLYYSDKTHTERYYLGYDEDGQCVWITIKII